MAPPLPGAIDPQAARPIATAAIEASLAEPPTEPMAQMILSIRDAGQSGAAGATDPVEVEGGVVDPKAARPDDRLSQGSDRLLVELFHVPARSADQVVVMAGLAPDVGRDVAGPLEPLSQAGVDQHVQGSEDGGAADVGVLAPDPVVELLRAGLLGAAGQDLGDHAHVEWRCVLHARWDALRDFLGGAEGNYAECAPRTGLRRIVAGNPAGGITDPIFERRVLVRLGAWTGAGRGRHGRMQRGRG